MSVFYVFQGKTYAQERAGGYVWSPQLTRSGGKNSGFTTMTKVEKGDLIFHHSAGKIMAISIAQTNCYEAEIPPALLPFSGGIWSRNGYRIDTRYIDILPPVSVTDSETKDWLVDNYVAGSAFTQLGMGKQQYMCHLPDKHAVFFFKKILTHLLSTLHKSKPSRLVPTNVFDKHVIGRALKNEALICDLDACVKDYMTLNPGISDAQAEADLIAQADRINENDDLEYSIALLKLYSNPKHSKFKTSSEHGRKILDGFDASDHRILLENRDYLDQAVIGELANDDKVFVYDYLLLIEAMCEENDWTAEEAIEWIDFNTLGTSATKYPLIAEMDLSIDDMDFDLEDDSSEVILDNLTLFLGLKQN